LIDFLNGIFEKAVVGSDKDMISQLFPVQVYGEMLKKEKFFSL
jgi:hypothetical protein